MAKKNHKSAAEPKLTVADAVVRLHSDDVAYVRFLLTREDALGTGSEYLDLVRRLVAAAEYRATVAEGAVKTRAYFRDLMSFALLEDRSHDQRRADQAEMDHADAEAGIPY